MTTTLEQVYHYRRLLDRCSSSAGLEMAEIEELDTIEADLASLAPGHNAVEIAAVVRGGKANDRVKVVAVGPTAMTLASCPYVEPGTTVELVIDDDEHFQSYRFKAVVATLQDDGDSYLAGLELIGAPLLLRHTLRTLESIAARAA